jgi:aminodeoxyfutalosine synthase
MTTNTVSLEGLAERVAAGEAIGESDAQLILDTPDLITVGVMAGDIRERLHGRSTTFVRVFAVHAGAVPVSAPSGTQSGELRIVGTPGSVEAAVRAVRATVALAFKVPVTGFSLADLHGLDAPLREVCARLKDAGLDGVAEVPLDRVTDPEAAVQAARDAGLDVLRLTTHAVAPEQRISIAVRARDLQRAVGGLRAFAPLPRETVAAAPTTGYDDLKQIAVARLLVTNIPSIQVGWVGYGPKLAQVALTMGADDVDEIAAVDAGVLGPRRSPIEEIRGNIRAAGLQPVERDGRFAALAQ